MKNYRTLIIAGLGSIGGSLLTFDLPVLKSFDAIWAIDIKEPRDNSLRGRPFLRGDITDPAFMDALLKKVEMPAVLLNLTSAIDTVKLRGVLEPYSVAYMDSAASHMADPEEHRYSRLIPYTMSDLARAYPHWLCWGSNPGMVEIIARSAVEENLLQDSDCRVEIMEWDQLRSDAPGSVPVSWSPRDLIDEIMLAPVLEVQGHSLVERGSRAERTKLRWEREEIDAWFVAHEDIWNLGMLKYVESARFTYALSPEVMEVLSGSVERATELLQVPGESDSIAGDEQLVVRVESRGQKITRVWRMNHHGTQRRFGMNVVQYQVSTSLLFALSLLQFAEMGMRRGTYSASSLPIGADDWPRLWDLMNENGIAWVREDTLSVQELGPEPVAPQLWAGRD